jgi:maltooligosyltrehalose trehalohydrolase
MADYNPIFKGTDGCTFRVWAPEKKKMSLHLVHPAERMIEMQKNGQGYYSAEVSDISPGTRYFFRPGDDTSLPDPASHFQPEGVHGPSEVVDHNSFKWTDNAWRGIPFSELILYELHVGTFTPEGTFEAIIPRLTELKETGINAIELMPVTQFPGSRNWGYDRVFPYAVQNSYGGPDGLKRLVDACHANEIAVFLDVIYNHMGPEGNYFSRFGPWFTDWYKTPWGEAINFDREWSDGVRDYYSHNPVFWFEKYHIDGLRLDAIHEVYDSGAVHFWELMHERIREAEQKMGRVFYTVAESDLNSPKVLAPVETGGYGFTAQWLDDYHHAIYVLLDSPGRKFYEDFGSMEQLAKAYTDGFVHSGDFVKFRKRKHGKSSAGIPGNRFVIFIQNHDIVGNRAMAERLSVLVSFERLKLAAAALLLSPYVPMLFMGEEYAEENPFFYFISHSDKDLIEAVRKGRKKEFEGFNWEGEPPDPQDEEAFNHSKLQWHLKDKGKHAILLQWHKKLIAFRKTNPILQNFSKNDIRVAALEQSGLSILRKNKEDTSHLVCFLNFSEEPVNFTLPLLDLEWEKLLDSGEKQWMELKDDNIREHAKKGKSQEKVVVNPQGVVVYGTW